jgi:NAD(P)-dependent dehydrogenase (short-subunit alcohol dehydrogenase family)
LKKTVLITGCSSGIGKATAQFFARNDWNVVAAAREPAKETELARLKDVLVTRLDVRDRNSIEHAINEGIKRFAKIDVLINNAGFGQYGIFEAIPREKVQEQFDVNVFGVMDVTRALLPHFRKNKNGIIINISSGAGIYTVPMISLYCASKFALEGFSEALAYELASQNIIVKIVEPYGGVNGTLFNERSAKENVPTESLADYNHFIKHTNEAMSKMAAARTKNSDDVAEAIYSAATDGTTRLRYLVGNDTRGFIKARQTMADQEYVEFMRANFLPKP